MPRRGHSPEQILNKLRQVEVSVANGMTVALSVREIGVTEQTLNQVQGRLTTVGVPSTTA